MASHIDLIMEELTTAGFTTGTVTDRERARLLAQEVLSVPQDTMMDLYELAQKKTLEFGDSDACT